MDREHRGGKEGQLHGLAEDPFAVDPAAIKDIPVVAAAFEGTVYEVPD